MVGEEGLRAYLAVRWTRYWLWVVAKAHVNRDPVVELLLGLRRPHTEGLAARGISDQAIRRAQVWDAGLWIGDMRILQDLLAKDFLAFDRWLATRLLCVLAPMLVIAQVTMYVIVHVLFLFLDLALIITLEGI